MDSNTLRGVHDLSSNMLAAYVRPGIRTVAVASVFALCACTNSDLSTLVLKRELTAQWQALDATQRMLGDRIKPTDWSAGVFVGSTQIADILNRLIGYKLENVAEDAWLAGTTITIESLKLSPAMGYARSEIILHAERRDLKLDLKLIANLMFQGVDQSQDEDGEAIAIFRMEPLEVQPKATFGLFRANVTDFWAMLAPQLAVALSDPDLFKIPVPIRDRVAINLQVDKSETEEVNRGTHATVTYKATLPLTVIEERVTYGAPIFRPEGISLLARPSSEGQQIGPATSPPDQSEKELESLVSQMKADVDKKTAAFTGSATEATVWLGRGLFDGLIERIGTIPQDHRQVRIQAVSYSGKLADQKWRDDFLGDGGYYAELANANNAYVTITLGAPRIQWNQKGLAFSLPVDAVVNAEVKVHFDPLVGGGVGTSLGINGGASGTVNATTSTELVKSAAFNAVVINTTLSCDAVKATVATDGRLKIDLGWISVPKVGLKMEMPLGRYQVGQVALLDDRPIFVQMPTRDPRLIENPDSRKEIIKRNPWAVVAPVPAMKLRIIPKSVKQDESGYAMSVTVHGEPIQVERTKSAMMSARAAVEQEATAYKQKISEFLKKQDPVQTCSGDPTIAVLLGPVEFGPRNEIVKFARNAWSDITKGPGPNNELRKAVEAAIAALPPPPRPPSVYIAVGKDHGGLGVQVGSWKF